MDVRECHIPSSRYGRSNIVTQSILGQLGYPSFQQTPKIAGTTQISWGYLHPPFHLAQNASKLWLQQLYRTLLWPPTVASLLATSSSQGNGPVVPTSSLSSAQIPTMFLGSSQCVAPPGTFHSHLTSLPGCFLDCASSFLVSMTSCSHFSHLP